MEPLTKDALLLAPRQQLIDTILSQQAHNEQLEARLQELEFRIGWFERQLFGTKSERFSADAAQTALDLGLTQTQSKVHTQHIPAHTRETVRPQQGHGRGAMPTHLPVKDVVIQPREDVSGMVRIDEEITWEYDYKSDGLFIRRYIRPKYVRPAHEQQPGGAVVIGTLPARPVEKGNMGPGLMAQITVDKYVYHTPLERQSRMFQSRYDVRFAESLLCDTVGNVGFWFEPLQRCMIEDLLAATYLQADETHVKVLWHEVKGTSHTGWYWGYYAPTEKILVFDFQMSREQRGPTDFLKDFKGILQCDDYGGYNEVRSRADIVRMACMAHVRRKFNDAIPYDRARCGYALETMKPWFACEVEAKEKKLDFDQRLQLRREMIGPSMANFGHWLKEQVPHLLPQNPATKAIAYAINQWPDFAPFLNDGRVELTNNLDENNMRPIAVGRKNYLFKGSPAAARRGGIIYSVLGTAQKHGLDPWKYAKEVLTYLPRVTSAHVRDFLPYNWHHHRAKYVDEDTADST